MKTASIEQKIFESEYQIEFSKNLISACGLFCGSCGIYLASKKNDTEKLLHYAIVLINRLKKLIVKVVVQKKNQHIVQETVYL